MGCTRDHLRIGTNKYIGNFPIHKKKIIFFPLAGTLCVSQWMNLDCSVLLLKDSCCLWPA